MLYDCQSAQLRNIEVKANKFEIVIGQTLVTISLAGLGWLGFVPYLLLIGNLGFNSLKLESRVLTAFMISMSFCYLFSLAGITFWLCRKLANKLKKGVLADRPISTGQNE